MFSKRTSWDTSESRWSEALGVRRASALPVYDLTIANPTECGFEYDPHLLETLTTPAGLHYAANPLGLLEAREAVCAYYADHQHSMGARDQLRVEARHVLLTASTSEAYSFLFRLLCDPGDEVLIAQPSYPLFDFLADLDDVRLISYPLFYDHGWHLDIHALRERITDRTRAIVIVHPNNPTGHFTRDQDREELEQLAAEHNLALIVDEVFLDYAFDAGVRSFALGKHPALTFVLSGLSKVAGLPQMKLSWISSYGPSAILEPALARLEVIADTFLSVSAPMQHAMSTWLAGRHEIQQQIRLRVNDNLAYLDRSLVMNGDVNRLAVDGGWYVVLRVPSMDTGEETAIRLLRSSGVVVHPGSFFGMTAKGLLVISLLLPVEVFQTAIELLLPGVRIANINN
jgi:alanine-synthesizing transaminase